MPYKMDVVFSKDLTSPRIIYKPDNPYVLQIIVRVIQDLNKNNLNDDATVSKIYRVLK